MKRIFLILISVIILSGLLSIGASKKSDPANVAHKRALQKEIKFLLPKLIDDDPQVVEETRNELLEIGLPCVPLLIKALSNHKAALRYMTCELLARIRDETAVPKLIKLLNDSEEPGTSSSVASAAARTLGRLADLSAVPALTKKLASTDITLRYEAIRALGILRATSATDKIIPFLKDNTQTFFGYRIKCAAIEALGRIKATTAVKELIPLLKSEEIEPQTEEPVVNYVIKALELITQHTEGSLYQATDKEELIKKWEAWWGKHKKEYGVEETPEEEPQKEPEEK